MVDECRDIRNLHEMIGSTVAPMFTTREHGKLVLISTPPESPAHAFTDNFIREALARGDFFTLTYKDNPMLSAKRLRYPMNTLYPGGENNAIFRCEYCADFTVTDNEKRVVREWNETVNDQFFETYEGPKQPVRPYIGLDSISSALYLNRLSAAPFPANTVPFKSLPTMGSSDASTIAANLAWSSRPSRLALAPLRLPVRGFCIYPRITFEHE